MSAASTRRARAPGVGWANACRTLHPSPTRCRSTEPLRQRSFDLESVGPEPWSSSRCPTSWETRDHHACCADAPVRPRRPSPSGTPPTAVEETRVYVLDTSVLLADPKALVRFDEHAVVLPGRGADGAGGEAQPPRAGLGRPPDPAPARAPPAGARHRSSTPLPVNDDGGTLRVELNHQDLGRPARRRWPPTTTTTASWPSPTTSASRARRHRRHQGPAAAAQGAHRRA